MPIRKRRSAASHENEPARLRPSSGPILITARLGTAMRRRTTASSPCIRPNRFGTSGSVRISEVFCEFWGNHRLIVDINRCIFRPPLHPDWPTLSHGDIHWDTDPRQPGPASLQCVVLLTDIARDGGGFQCVPEVYQNLEAWLDRHARGKSFNFFKPGLKDGLTQMKEGVWSGSLGGVFPDWFVCAGATGLKGRAVGREGRASGGVWLELNASSNR